MFHQLTGKALLSKGGSYRASDIFCLWEPKGLSYTGDVYVRYGGGYAKLKGYGTTSVTGLRCEALYGEGSCILYTAGSRRPYVEP